jgi:hypothetical protein
MIRLSTLDDTTALIALAAVSGLFEPGYEEEARIREFYTIGVDKIVFRKALK